MLPLLSYPICTHAPPCSDLHKWSESVDLGFPISFFGVEGFDEPIDEGASFYNDAEIDLVCSMIEDLIKGEENGTVYKLKASEISVISPFREQVWRIRLKLRSAGLGDVGEDLPPHSHKKFF